VGVMAARISKKQQNEWAKKDGIIKGMIIPQYDPQYYLWSIEIHRDQKFFKKRT
jgi:hypothetical protein